MATVGGIEARKGLISREESVFKCALGEIWRADGGKYESKEEKLDSTGLTKFLMRYEGTEKLRHYHFFRACFLETSVSRASNCLVYRKGRVSIQVDKSKR